MGKRFEKEYHVYYYEVDSNLNCKIESLMNYFMEIGMQHSESLGVGIDYLQKENLSWIFYKYKINIKRYPKYGENIKIITEPIGFNRFLASREYIVYDENNEIIVKAEAVLILMDLIKRRMTRISEEQYDIYGIDKDKKSNIVLSKVKKIENKMDSKNFEIKYSDIDSNKHVNNVKYVSYAIDSLSSEIIENYSLSNIEITFEKEAICGEVIKVEYEIIEDNNELKILHKIFNEKDIEITSLESKWSLKEN